MRQARALVIIGILAPLLACEKKTTLTAPLPATPYFEVTAFGALAGDTLSDQPAFDAAIASAGYGGSIFVPRGPHAGDAYLVDGLRLYSGQSLIGEDRTYTVVRARVKGSGDGIQPFATDIPSIGLHVRGLRLEDFAHGIDARGVQQSHFEDLWLNNNAINLVIGGTPCSSEPTRLCGCITDVFDRIKMTGAAERDLRVLPTDAYFDLNQNVFEACGFQTAEQPEDAPGSKLPQFWIAGGVGSTANRFTSNEFVNGLHVRGASGIALESNYFEGGTRQVVLESSRGVRVADNYFFNWDDSAVWIDSGNIDGIVVEANAFYGNPNNLQLPAVRVVAGVAVDCSQIRVFGNFYQDGLLRCIDEANCMDPPCSAQGSPGYSLEHWREP